MAKSESEVFRELQELCEPASKYLQNNFNPHTSIVITDSGISLEETVAFVPVKNGD